jgi:hypothetical protein
MLATSSRGSGIRTDSVNVTQLVHPSRSDRLNSETPLSTCVGGSALMILPEPVLGVEMRARLPPRRSLPLDPAPSTRDVVADRYRTTAVVAADVRAAVA